MKVDPLTIPQSKQDHLNLLHPHKDHHHHYHRHKKLLDLNNRHHKGHLMRIKNCQQDQYLQGHHLQLLQAHKHHHQNRTLISKDILSVITTITMMDNLRGYQWLSLHLQDGPNGVPMGDDLYDLKHHVHNKPLPH